VSEHDPLAIAREVLEREAAAIRAVSSRLGDSFPRAVELLERARGRVIVTGVGKSGLVGAKIAATLTSTGCPASFLHPTEALHGDLGIVGPADAVLVLSKSGRSAELLHLLPFLKRLGVPVIAVVESADSPVGREATVALELGRVEEACSLDLVPTASTTAALAVGDALAVTLLRRRGLTPEDFAYVHPGGLVGRTAARRVRDLMHGGDALPAVAETATLREALVEIVEKGLGITTLHDRRGCLAGVLTDGDLKRILLGPEGERPLTAPVNTFMSRTPRTVGPEVMVAQAVRLMEERSPGPVTSLVVVEGARAVGILHLHDCLRVTETPAAPPVPPAARRPSS
jgi:arabinose-5-phosphate isomerase